MAPASSFSASSLDIEVKIIDTASGSDWKLVSQSNRVRPIMHALRSTTPLAFVAFSAHTLDSNIVIILDNNKLEMFI